MLAPALAIVAYFALPTSWVPLATTVGLPRHGGYLRSTGWQSRCSARPSCPAYHQEIALKPTDRNAPCGPWTAPEYARDAAAARAAVRRAGAHGVGVNIEATIRLIRAADAMHGIARDDRRL